MQKLTSFLKSNGSELDTPCFVYDLERVRHNYRTLKKELSTDLVISMKANACVEIYLRCSDTFSEGENKGGGVEVASLQELNRAVGGSSGKLYVNSPAMNETFMRAGLASKATVILDSLYHIQLAQELGAKQGVMIRLNSSVLSYMDPSHPKVREDHFGMEWETALEAIERLKQAHIPLIGIHLFKGSYTFQKTAQESVPAILRIVNEIESRLGYALERVNVGGGFEEHWEDHLNYFPQYRSVLSQLTGHHQVLHESGRGLFATAGYFVTRVISTKQLNGQTIAVCNGGIAQAFLLAQTENTFRKYKVPTLLNYGAREDAITTTPITFVGPSCSKEDVIAKVPPGFATVSRGDYVIFPDCGAYYYSYSPSKFLLLKEAKEYVLD